MIAKHCACKSCNFSPLDRPRADHHIDQMLDAAGAIVKAQYPARHRWDASGK